MFVVCDAMGHAPAPWIKLMDVCMYVCISGWPFQLCFRIWEFTDVVTLGLV